MLCEPHHHSQYVELMLEAPGCRKVRIHTFIPRIPLQCPHQQLRTHWPHRRPQHKLNQNDWRCLQVAQLFGSPVALHPHGWGAAFAGNDEY